MSCSECGGPVSKASKSGLCRKCFNRKIGADPEVARRKSESLKRYAADPRNAAVMRERSQRGAAKRLSNPVHAAWAANHMRKVVQPLSCTPEELARPYRREAALTAAETRMAWCPPEYRDNYRSIIRKGYTKAEARPMILAAVALDRQRVRNRMSPFEKQDAALAKMYGE